jgi:hypothetical protein
MFALGWITAVLIKNNVFAYLYANLLVVMLAKLAEYRLASSGYLAVVAQLTWQVCIIPWL